MKFKIRFADQIVGFFVILCIVSLVFVVVMVGRRSKRWFAKDALYKTSLPSAGGLSSNMAVQYRGFTIGNVRDFYLTDKDAVEVVFAIHEEYRDRVTQGSLVEMVSSPIGLGSQFILYSGSGITLKDGSFIPAVGSDQARELIRRGLAEEPKQEDSISLIMTRVSLILDEVNILLAEINAATGPGSDTEIGKIIGSLAVIMNAAESLAPALNDLKENLSPALESVTEILANVSGITGELARPDGLLYTALDPQEELYTSLTGSLTSVRAILGDLEKATAVIPGQVPQLSGLVLELRASLSTAEDLLTALTNNPLLRGGVPQRPQTQGGVGPRDLRF